MHSCYLFFHQNVQKIWYWKKKSDRKYRSIFPMTINVTFRDSITFKIYNFPTTHVCFRKFTGRLEMDREKVPLMEMAIAFPIFRRLLLEHYFGGCEKRWGRTKPDNVVKEKSKTASLENIKKILRWWIVFECLFSVKFVWKNYLYWLGIFRYCVLKNIFKELQKFWKNQDYFVFLCSGKQRKEYTCSKMINKNNMPRVLNMIACSWF